MKNGEVLCINSKVAHKTVSGFFHVENGVASQRFEITADPIEKVQQFARINAVNGKYRYDPVDSKFSLTRHFF